MNEFSKNFQKSSLITYRKVFLIENAKSNIKRPKIWLKKGNALRGGFNELDRDSFVICKILLFLIF